MYEHLRGTKLVKLTRPFLLTLTVAYICLGLSLLLLAIAGIVLQSTYATISVGIWAGFAGCMASAWWAFTLSRLMDKMYAMRLIFLVLLGHIAFFVLCFFAASSDFVNLQTVLTSILESTYRNCSTPIEGEVEILIGRLLTDHHEIVFTLAAIAFDLVLIAIGSKIRGARKIVLFGLLNRKRAASGNSKSIRVEQNTKEEAVAEGAIEITKKLGYNDVLKMLMTGFGLITLSVASLAIAVEIVGLVIGVRLSILPPGWAIIAAVLMFMTRRMKKKKRVWWFKFLLSLFILGSIANCVTITLAIIGFRTDYGVIVNLTSTYANLRPCSALNTTNFLLGGNDSTATDKNWRIPTFLGQSGNSSWPTEQIYDEFGVFNSSFPQMASAGSNRMLWKVTLGTFRFLLVFFLLLLNISKAVGASYFIKAWTRQKTPSCELQRVTNYATDCQVNTSN